MAIIWLLVFSVFTLSSNPLRKNTYLENQTSILSERYGYVFIVRQSSNDSNFGQNYLVMNKLFQTGSDSANVSSCQNECQQTKWRRKNCFMNLGVVLLFLAGDISPNPGPRWARYPCGDCGYGVSNNQHAIFCERCMLWIHLKCLPNVTVQMYNELGKNDDAWFCPPCSVMAQEEEAFYTRFSDSFFETSRSDSNFFVSNEDQYPLLHFTDSFFNQSNSSLKSLNESASTADLNASLHSSRQSDSDENEYQAEDSLHERMKSQRLN